MTENRLGMTEKQARNDRKMKIGNIDLGDKPLFLAPMEDVTDASFRFICKEFGADMMYTEFISSDGLIRDARKSLEKLVTYDYEAPIGIQIYGNIPEAMVDAARMAEQAAEISSQLESVKGVPGAGHGLAYPVSPGSYLQELDQFFTPFL